MQDTRQDNNNQNMEIFEKMRLYIQKLLRKEQLQDFDRSHCFEQFCNKEKQMFLFRETIERFFFEIWDYEESLKKKRENQNV